MWECMDQRVQKQIYIVIKTVNQSSISSCSHLPVLAVLWDFHVQKAKVRQELLIEQTRQQVCHWFSQKCPWKPELEQLGWWWWVAKWSEKAAETLCKLSCNSIAHIRCANRMNRLGSAVPTWLNEVLRSTDLTRLLTELGSLACQNQCYPQFIFNGFSMLFLT